MLSCYTECMETTYTLYINEEYEMSGSKEDVLEYLEELDIKDEFFDDDNFECHVEIN